MAAANDGAEDFNKIYQRPDDFRRKWIARLCLKKMELSDCVHNLFRGVRGVENSSENSSRY